MNLNNFFFNLGVFNNNFLGLYFNSTSRKIK